MARRESDYSEEKQFYQDIFSMLCMLNPFSPSQRKGSHWKYT
jgi:hypothetical protein